MSSPNGVDWNKVKVVEFAEYDSCETAVNNGDVFIGACNVDASAYLIFQSQDNGANWNLIQTVNGVLCPSDGGTRPTFNMIEGVPVIFYMTGFNEEEAVENGQSNTPRLVSPGELVLQQGNEPHVVDMDSPGPPLAESFPAKKIGNFIVAPYYHRDSHTIRLAVTAPPFTLPMIVVLGPAPLFTTFFGLICAEGPDGIVNVIAPGAHFQYDPVQGFQNLITPTPLDGLTDGPVGVSQERPEGVADLVGNVILSTLFRGGSADYAQFGFVQPRPIPTLSEWGLIALAGALMLSGAFYFRRKGVLS